MHVLILPSWYKTKRNRLHGSFFKEQALALQKQGIKVTIAFNEVWPITLIGKVNEKRGITVEDDDGLKVYRYKDFNFFPKNPLMFRSFNKRFDKLFKRVEKEQGKIDIIHGHSSFWAGIGGAYLKRKYDIPLVITEHSSLKHSRYVKDSYIKYIVDSYKKADRLISVGENLKKELYDLSGREDIKVINNIVDLSKFSLNNDDNKSKDTVFFSCGFLDMGKGYDVLIKSFTKEFKGKNAILKIGGEGEERLNLESLIKDLDVKDQVILLGELKREEVAEEMKNCDIFVLASRHETFGVVYIEALASGKPIIGTKNGGAEEIIKDYNGLLVQIDNIEELSKAMQYLKENKEKYNKFKIREKCIEKYSEENIIPKIIKVYKELL
ncbi:glycosyltransferase [Clostridium fallax]|uniref:Glycosyltransferase involved in cell wall bisynthesis n=1 Tax=Clostridium fallax TaxID=1533 RepID=A0A1M4WQF3_9CLOT|nr:glycosyltransferase [Clostridium fallax]SHE83456.1 Glycosyltransferase involved in cell wall bisynthesis [Clostridium fallax]SQB06274.1 group 1 glycosyl transferase [Clostridium fallax]